ncbi:MAG: YqeG family HAD IIIA-type phosphatase [Pseudarthrobacter sp.]
MVPLHILRPHEYRPSIFAIDLERLKDRGIRAIMLDLDNTLVRWNDPDPTPQVQEWLRRVESLGLLPCIVSNNRGTRVQQFAERVGVPFIPRAIKPRRRGFLEAMNRLGVKPSETVVVGDQLFTDILGGKRAGAYTILVVPIHPKEFIGTRVVRFVERQVLKRLQKDGLRVQE